MKNASVNARSNFTVMHSHLSSAKPVQNSWNSDTVWTFLDADSPLCHLEDGWTDFLTILSNEVTKTASLQRAHIFQVTLAEQLGCLSAKKVTKTVIY